MITHECVRSRLRGLPSRFQVRPADLHAPDRSPRLIPIGVRCNEVLFRAHEHLRPGVHSHKLHEGETVTSEEVCMFALNKPAPHAHTTTFSGVRPNHGVPVARQPYVEPIARHDLGRMEHACLKCGALHRLSERVQKAGSTNLHPLFGMCCGDGSIELPAPPPAPDPLRRFFSASTPEAQHFRENIPQYNAALSPSHLSELRLTTVSIEVEVGPWCSKFTVNSTTKLVHSSLPTDNHPSMPSCTSSTLARH